MSGSIYLTQRDEIYNQYLNFNDNNDYKNKISKNHSFNLVSANFFNFLPEIDYNQHHNLFNEITLHNRLTHFEQTHKEALDYVTTENLSPETLKMLKEQPCVISSFHFGSYRLLNAFLTKNNIPYTAVCPKAILEKEEEMFRENLFSNKDAKFIELESPALGLKIIKELKNGRNVFLYFDGFRGALKGRSSEDEKISFLDKEIYVKKGVAHLANVAKVPLITTIAYRKNIDDVRLHFFDPIMPNFEKNKEEYALEATKLAYDRFSYFLKKYPGQWESWLYLHKQVECREQAVLTDQLSNEILGKGFSFNTKRYGIFKILEDSFLFDRFSYVTYPIDKDLHEYLEKLAEDKNFPIETKIEKQTLKELYSSQVLVFA